MKKILSILVCLFIASGSAGAISGIEIGLKTGIIDNYSQSQLSLGGNDINRLNMVGGQISFSRLPMIDVIVAGDYSWSNQNYNIAGYDLDFKLRDFAVTASAVYPVNLPVVSPYIGGGIGTHSLSYEYIRPLSLSLADNGVEIPETSTYFGYHGLLGAKVNIPAFPLGLFMEARFNRVNSPGDDISFSSYSGGIFLALP